MVILNFPELARTGDNVIISESRHTKENERSSAVVLESLHAGRVKVKLSVRV